MKNDNCRIFIVVNFISNSRCCKLHMNLLKSILLIVFLAPICNAQWRSEYYPKDWAPPVTKNFYTDAFLQDYSYAGFRCGQIPAEIPTNLPVFNVSLPPFNADKSGTNDATMAIQNAINAAQNVGGGVVYLPTGVYKLNPGIQNYCLKISSPKIYLKGDGVYKTKFLNTSYKMKNKSVIYITGSGNWKKKQNSVALITQDIMQPVQSISVDNPSLFKLGDLVLVRNSITNEWIKEHKMEDEWLNYGTILTGMMYCRYITGIDAINKKLFIDVPVRYALKTRDTACVFKVDGMINYIGLSDFSIGNVQHPAKTGWDEDDFDVVGAGANDCDGSWMIKMNYVVNSWVKNVETFKPNANTTGTNMLSNGLQVTFSKNVTIENCSVGYSQYGGSNTNGYAYYIAANEVLIKNSVSSNVRHGFVFLSMWSSGNVLYQCADIKTGFQCAGDQTTEGWGSDHHMHFSHSNLTDKCYSDRSAFLAFYRQAANPPKHCITGAHSAFWNITTRGTLGYCLWTQQARYGYAIGTTGTNPFIKVNENFWNSACKTDPIDIAEGEGIGASLEPQSLYIDQLNRRLVNNSFKREEVVEPEHAVSMESNHEIKISPNPSVDYITIETEKNLPYSTHYIRRYTGEIVKELNMDGNVITISLEDPVFTNGVYFVESNSITTRFIILK